MQQRLAQAFQQYLSDQEFLFEPVTLYDPINYFMSLGGKRMRPQLCLLSAALFSDRPEDALPQAYAIELFHNFTLVHDDIMDEAPLRRGMPTVHHKYNTNTAILSGDVMLIHCYPYLAGDLDADRALQAIRVFTDTAIGICHGQQYDLDFELLERPSTEAYLEMIHGKTAILLGCAMALGSLVAGKEEAVQEQLFQIGVDMGLSFQIQDDYLDVFGLAEKTGKVQGGDIRQGKKTLPYLKALEVGGDRISKELVSLYSGEKSDEDIRVARVLEIFDSLGVDKQVKALRDSYYARACQALHALDCISETRMELLRLFEDLLDRDH
ncbi:MAG: polyprenyl synthetase family protein [Saprospiraceae bacterium]|nr:polyprenyl synthetase family protein [Saprospiraceae bacterium]